MKKLFLCLIVVFSLAIVGCDDSSSVVRPKLAENTDGFYYSSIFSEMLVVVGGKGQIWEYEKPSKIFSFLDNGKVGNSGSFRSWSWEDGGNLVLSTLSNNVSNTYIPFSVSGKNFFWLKQNYKNYKSYWGGTITSLDEQKLRPGGIFASNSKWIFWGFSSNGSLYLVGRDTRKPVHFEFIQD